MGGCSILERLQEVANEALVNYGSNTGSKCNYREEFMEERIGDLDIWDNHDCGFSCKLP